jgi:hypothetical protein
MFGILIAAALSAGLACAQNVSSSVKGVVVDASQGGIPGAACSLADQATGRVLTATAWSDGSFTFPNVLPGTYSLRIESSGFKTLTIKGVVVTASEVRTVGNLALQVGEVKETVSVSADSAVVAVQLASGEKSGLLTGEQLNNIALKGRDFWAMLQTLPGVVDDGSQGRETIVGNNSRGTYINGGSASSKNYSVDGIFSLNASNATTVIQPNMDATAEVKVLTSNYQAEYGRMSSGVISVITKSGARDFHGSGWATFRHEELNANSFFNNATGTPKSPYRYHIYGYSIGGPVYVPKRFNTDKSKLFFFFSQEFDPITTNYGSQFANTPTAAERNGDFSHSFDVNGALNVIKDPTNGQAFPNNMVPANRISKVGQSLLNFFPLPNYTDPNPRNLYQWNLRSTFSAPTPVHNDVLRLDYNPFQSLTFTYRMIRNTQETQPPWNDWEIGNNFLLTPIQQFQPGIGHMFQATKIFSPTLVNEAKFAYTLNNIHSDYADPSKVARSAVGNLPQLFPDAGSPDTAPNVYFGSQPANAVNLSLGPGNWFWRGAAFSYTDNVSKVWSKHTLKAGFAIDHNRATAIDAHSSWRGSFNFSRDTNNPFDTNNGFSNALIGTFSSYNELLGPRPMHDVTLNVFEEYVQDNWRVTKRLTLDFGLRLVSQPPEYDLKPNTVAHFDPALYVAGQSPALYMPTIDPTGKRVGMDPISKTLVPAAYIGLFVPNTGNPANGSAVCGANGYPAGCFKRSSVFFAPRFGFAYDLFGTGKTAVRGGFGIFYDTADANSFESSEGNPPISYNPVQYYGNLSTMTSSTGLLGPSYLNSQTAIGQIPLPMTMNFSVGIQHQLPGNTVVEVSYVGSQVRHMLMTREINPIPMFARFNPANGDPTSPGKPLPDNFLRPYAGYGSITPYEMTGTSNYNSLQAAINRRPAKGLQIGIAYTFSKDLGATASDPYFSMRQWTYGPLPQDRTHVFAANFTYQLPRLSAVTGFRPAAWILDNWQLSGLTSFVSGAPFTPSFNTTDGQDITGSAEGPRITIVGNPNLANDQRTFYQNFNTAAFARTPVGSFGNAGVGILRGPGVNNWDLAIGKQFPLRSEQRYIRFRTEFFNAWNHTQFSGLNTNAVFNPAGQQVNPTFGAFNAARSPRIIQLSARVVF